MAITVSKSEWSKALYGREARFQNILSANPIFEMVKISVGNETADAYSTGGLAIDLGSSVIWAEGISDEGLFWQYEPDNKKFRIRRLSQAGATELANNATQYLQDSEVWVQVWRRSK